MLQFLNRHLAHYKIRNKEVPDFVKKYVSAMLAQSEMNQAIQAQRFVVFDTETTGLNPEKDKILSIGAISVQNGEINFSDSIEIFVKSEKTGTPNSIVIHEILHNELSEAYSDIEGLKYFLEFVGNDILVAHHSNFDVAMVSKTLQKHFGIPLLNVHLDTASMYKRLEIKSLTYQEIVGKNLSLDTLCQRYQIQNKKRHNAAGDALATAEIFQRLFFKAKRNGVKTVKNLLQYF